MNLFCILLIFIFSIIFSPVLAQSELEDLINSAQEDLNIVINQIELNGISKLQLFDIDQLMFTHIELMDFINKSKTKAEDREKPSILSDKITQIIKVKIPNYNSDNSINDSSNKQNSVFSWGIQESQIKGVVRNSITSEAVTNATVQLANIQGDVYKEVEVDSRGRYHFSNLSGGGNYYIAVTSVGFEDQGYQDVPCHGGFNYGCEITDITAIYLDENDSIDGVDFNLTPVSTITGNIVSEDGHVPGGFVYLYDHKGDFLEYVYISSLSDGSFILEIQQIGNYYVLFGALGHNREIYNGIVCDSICDFSSTEPIYIDDITNFSIGEVVLTTHKPISGDIKDHNTGLPISDFDYIEFYDIDRGTVKIRISGDSIESDGSWTNNLYAGNFLVRVVSDKYLIHYADDQNCPSAELSSCESVQINPTTYIHSSIDPTNGIELKLIEGGAIYGIISDPTGIGGYYGNVELYNEIGEIVDTVQIDSNDSYKFLGLDNGIYYTSAKANYFHTTAYPSYYCDTNTDENHLCLDVLESEPIIIVDHETINDVDITLQFGPSISGFLKDDQDNPMEGFAVRALSLDEGRLLERGYAVTDSSGAFQLKDLYFDDFYIQTNQQVHSSGRIYRTEIYQDVFCDDNYRFCDVSQASSIPISEALDYSGYTLNITKKATLNFTFNSDISDFKGYINVYDQNGQFLERNYISNSRTETFYMPAGSYRFLYTYNEEGYDVFSSQVSKVYGGSNCYSNCDVLKGNLVTVEDNQIYDFEMAIDTSFSAEIIIDKDRRYDYLMLYQNDELIAEAELFSITSTIYFNVIGDIKIGMRKNGFYYNFYDGIDCIDVTCGLNQGEVVPISPNENGTFDFVLLPLTKISGYIQNKLGQGIGKNISLYTLSQGELNRISQVSTIDGNYEIEGIPEGQYYVYANRDFINDTKANGLYGGVFCAEIEYCDFTNAQIVNVNSDDYVTGIDFIMPDVGKLRIENTQYPDGDLVDGISYWLYHLIDDSYKYFYYGSMGVSQIAQIDSLYEKDYKLMAVQRLDGSYYKTVYPNISCSSYDTQTCLSKGENVNISFGETTLIDDFVISQPTSISVNVIDGEFGNYLPGYRVNVYRNEGGRSFTEVSEEGVLEIPVSHEESYYIEVESDYNDSHLGMLYDNISCELGVGVSCQLEQGVLISGDLGVQIPIDMSLISRPLLSVKVKDDITNHLLPSELLVYDENEEFFNSYESNSGEFNINLSAGQYYMMAYANNYRVEAYPDIRCSSAQLRNCDSDYLLIDVLSDDSANYSFELDLKNGVGGYVIDAMTGEPVADANIDFWDSGGNYELSVVTTENGGFIMPEDLFVVYVSTEILRPSLLYDELYDNKQCIDGPVIQGLCDFEDGDFVNSRNGATILFELETDLVFKHNFE